MIFRLLVLPLSILLATIVYAQAAKRVALLIANHDYAREVGVLQTPSHDVKLVSGALRKVGFDDVEIVSNASRIKILTAIDRYANKLASAGDGAIGFFYYSGHGAANEQDKRNYLIPVGVKRLDQQVWYKSVPLDEVVNKLSKRAGNAAHFVIFDACRNVLNLRTKGSKGFVPISEHRGMLIGFASEPGQAASDQGADGGPYAKSLARELIKPGLHHLDLFQNVKESVFKNTGVQLPWTRDGMLGRVYFAGKPTAKSEEQKKITILEWNGEITSRDGAFSRFLGQTENKIFRLVAFAKDSAVTDTFDQRCNIGHTDPGGIGVNYIVECYRHIGQWHINGYFTQRDALMKRGHVNIFLDRVPKSVVLLKKAIVRRYKQ
ncbi:MAG: caspase family protein [Pseudomonadota bacterium]